MKILICTQKVDSNDPVLGFFHGWLIEFSKYYEHITVICLEKGEYNLPPNIQVLSLGKEVRPSRAIYVTNFYSYILQESKNYDAVLAHMNPEYIVLGGLLWKLWKKKIFLWYNHKKGGLVARIAFFFAKHIFYTSPFAFATRYKKSTVMPVGIDSNLFTKDFSLQKPNATILSLGRISPVKKLEVLIDALSILDTKGIDYITHIYGDAPKRDTAYYSDLKKRSATLIEKNKVIFHSGVPHSETPGIYNRHMVFVNLTPAGSFDKTLLEASLCGMYVISSNNSFDTLSFQPFLVPQDNEISLAEKLESVLVHPTDFEDSREKVREYILNNHSLSLLSKKLTDAISS